MYYLHYSFVFVLALIMTYLTIGLLFVVAYLIAGTFVGVKSILGESGDRTKNFFSLLLMWPLLIYGLWRII